jgi:hypothetical protein
MRDVERANGGCPRGGDQARQRRGDEAAKPQGEAARRRGDEATRRRGETARRRDGETTKNVIRNCLALAGTRTSRAQGWTASFCSSSRLAGRSLVEASSLSAISVRAVSPIPITRCSFGHKFVPVKYVTDFPICRAVVSQEICSEICSSPSLQCCAPLRCCASRFGR